MRRFRAAALAVLCAVSTVGATGATATAVPTGGRSFAATSATGATRSTLRLAMAAAPAGRSQALSPATRAGIAALLRPEAGTPAVTATKSTAVLRCNSNPSWSDARGTLHARFNCAHHTINWGYNIARKVQAVITGPVSEAGVSWWCNGRTRPRNAPHRQSAGYLFHGTLKPVAHGDHVQFQDHMTFRVNIGGRSGTGSLVWAADVRAQR